MHRAGLWSAFRAVDEAAQTLARGLQELGEDVFGEPDRPHSGPSAPPPPLSTTDLADGLNPGESPDATANTTTDPQPPAHDRIGDEDWELAAPSPEPEVLRGPSAATEPESRPVVEQSPGTARKDIGTDRDLASRSIELETRLRETEELAARLDERLSYYQGRLTTERELRQRFESAFDTMRFALRRADDLIRNLKARVEYLENSTGIDARYWDLEDRSTSAMVDYESARRQIERDIGEEGL